MSESQPDATRAFSLLRKLDRDGDHTAEETHELVELVRTMASENLISRFEAKFDAQRDMLDARYKGIIWTIGIVGGALGVLITVALFVLGG